MSKNEEHERAVEICGFDLRTESLQTIYINPRTKEERLATGRDINEFASACEWLRSLP
jgi:hypothetical protein